MVFRTKVIIHFNITFAVSDPALLSPSSISTTPPESEDDLASTRYSEWHLFGQTFLIKSDINHWVLCSPGHGSIVDLPSRTGQLPCRIVHYQSTCTDTDGVYELSNDMSTGFQLSIRQNGDTSIMYFWDGSTSFYFPTHDPCAMNEANHTPLSNPKGWLYIRNSGGGSTDSSHGGRDDCPHHDPDCDMGAMGPLYDDMSWGDGDMSMGDGGGGMSMDGGGMSGGSGGGGGGGHHG